MNEENRGSVVEDAVVEFADGHFARFTTVEILENGALLATLAQTFGVPAGRDHEEPQRVSAVDTAVYGPTMWRSVHAPRHGALMVLTWRRSHSEEDYRARQCVEGDVTAAEAPEHARKWLTNYLSEQGHRADSGDHERTNRAA